MKICHEDRAYTVVWSLHLYRTTDSGIVSDETDFGRFMEVREYKLESWISRPLCKKDGCDRPAVTQRINQGRLGTEEYCTYWCEEHK